MRDPILTQGCPTPDLREVAVSSSDSHRLQVCQPEGAGSQGGRSEDVPEHEGTGEGRGPRGRHGRDSVRIETGLGWVPAHPPASAPSPTDRLWGEMARGWETQAAGQWPSGGQLCPHLRAAPGYLCPLRQNECGTRAHSEFRKINNLQGGIQEQNVAWPEPGNPSCCREQAHSSPTR